jgi:hypothetical protein
MEERSAKIRVPWKNRDPRKSASRDGTEIREIRVP